ncbi:DNA replication and repair protein RecF [Candidatus Trichorickettsia mobilis]|uniref:DNA replication and repair protein RecF n=1 Tax=Candidatus Trichorickettsia mobilis TaxID=1346319 RepID=A0ABZ0UXU7_9RICK|nr:DNA replication/repair protein RecF [Candidatus Trichorickettsia mobilis]WPY00884.1 DNA replication and repair protein RecF [Candidatus Trichorickettsia mobilis]
MLNTYLQNLRLENYRNFQTLALESSNNPIILIGENGIGKTNVLEAISLLFPGRGIRAAKLEDIGKSGEKSWSIAAKLQSKVGIAELRTTFNANTGKRYIEFNGAKIPNSELSMLSSILWLTPQMEGIFLAASSDRRKFLDRIVFTFYHEHATKVSKYEYYMHERAKILQQESINSSWLQIIENKMAELSVVIATNRTNVLAYLQSAIDELDSEFPKAILAIEGIELQIDSTNIVELVQQQLESRRNQDRLSGRTTFGTHRSDLIVKHKIKNIPAQFCSTGEQKAMLITIMLAQVISIIKITSTAPILLLDEVFVHLDSIRKQYLINFLVTVQLQIWITATDLDGIEELANYAELVNLDILASVN